MGLALYFPLATELRETLMPGRALVGGQRRCSKALVEQRTHRDRDRRRAY